ncbi:MAG TPA: glycosyltransferase family 4 protein [Gammaproteobacteria bacterium]
MRTDDDNRPAGPLRQPLRLLVIASDTYPPRRVDVSVLFGEELAGRGHGIDWVLQSEAPCGRAYVTSWGGGTVYVGAMDHGDSLARRVRKHLLGILNDLKVFRLLRRGRYDAVIVKDKFVSGVAALLAARLARTRFVYWLSYPFPEHYLYLARSGDARYPLLYRVRGTAFKVMLYRWLLPAADHVLVQSEQMRRDVAAEGVPPDKMTAVPMGIKATELLPLPANLRRILIPEDERCLLYLGTLGKVRRLDFLVRVLALVRRRVPEAKLYLVGRGDDPSDEQALVEEAARHGVLAAMRFVGELPREEALRYVREADVCVSPIYATPVLRPGSPTKLVEYLALGKAVVANDHPEQRLVIEQSGAGYCVPWDEQAFADAVVELLEAPPELRRAMGERGRRYVAEHRTYDKLADLVEQTLVRVVTPPDQDASATPFAEPGGLVDDRRPRSPR